MPELPEVQTVVSTLERQIKNAEIQSVDIYYDKIIDNVSAEEFSQGLVKQKFEKFDRRGKFLVFTLTDYILISHLRMEGKYFVYPQKNAVDKHTHVVFNLDIGQLHYNDVRKFGRFYLYKKNQELLALAHLGKEPFDESLTAFYCKNYCKNINTEIKYQLLDQAMIAGIGNIYADEICFLANVNPFVKSKYISIQKWDAIIKATREVLAEAIKAGGTTIRSYTSSLGVTGLFQQQLYVHSQETCGKCHGEVERIKLHGRSTYYCPNCQKGTPLFISITGSIGSGKSEVSAIVKSLGYKCISCDEVNHELLQKEEVRIQLAKILDCQVSKINNSYLAKRIFNDSQIKKAVEAYLHQQILNEVMQFYSTNNNEELLFAEVPLLFEVGWDYYFDCNVLVAAKQEIMIERLLKQRNMNFDDIMARISQQMPLEDKAKRADYIIDNNLSIEDLEKAIYKMIETLKRQKTI